MNEEIIIEKNVPIPTVGDRGGTITYALKRMEIGDSICITIDGNNIHALAKYCSIKVKSRKQPDGKRRIWRIS